MSLFPAYSLDKDNDKVQDTRNSTDDDKSWLRNNSFIGFGTAKSAVELSDSSIDTDEESGFKHHDANQHLEWPCTTEVQGCSSAKRSCSPSPLHNKKRKHRTICTLVDDLHVSLDSLGFIDVDPAPSDSILKKPHSKSKKSKKKLLKHFQKERYFYKKAADVIDYFDDEDVKTKTEDFNIRLRENPEDTQLWLQYVRFQDCIINESRSKADKKMSILNKAMESNPSSPELTNEFFSVMETYSTHDAIQTEAKKMLSKDNRNIIAWQWMINSCLYNITKLSVPSVLETFSLTLESLFRAFPNEPQHLLDILLECCTFLRQAGLWEQLWLIVQLSLELNLSTPGSNAFSISTNINEQKLRDAEDEIIVSGLPLGTLWLRLEYIRSCLHFLPLKQADDDPQRVVFSSDVASLLHPIHSSSSPHLIAILLISLKVPMIPMSNSAIMFIGLERITWSIESPEFLLAVLNHPYLINQVDESCLKVCNELLVGPQYLVENRPGCSEMFDCIDSLFECILTALVNDTETRELIALWRMRWYRLVGYGRCSKLAMKLLQAFPHSLPVYTDYAIFAVASNETVTGLKVLDRAVKHAGSSPLYVGCEKQKQHLAYLYKTNIELLVFLDVKLYRNRILKVMYKLTTGQNLNDEALECNTVATLKQRFDAVTKEMLADICNDYCKVLKSSTFGDIMLPPTQVSWFASHAWFLHVVDSSVSAKCFLESICQEISKLLDSNNGSLSLGSVILEGCYETLVCLIQLSQSADKHSSLGNVLRSAIQLYPNNLYFLHVASSIDILIGRWWSVSPAFLSQSSVFIKLFTIFVYRQKMCKLQGNISEDERASCQRKLYNLVRRTVCEGEVECRRSPLLWRLLLQFVAAQHPSEIKSTFYRALDLCPWVKSIYYDGAKILPEELGQIQDLIIEKELRIHITCEELEILRQDGDATKHRMVTDSMST